MIQRVVKQHRRLRPLMLILVLLAGGCDRSAPEYYPLDPGLSWYYTLHVSTMDGAEEQKFLVTGIQPFHWQGKPVHTRRTLDGTTVFYEKNAEGIYHIASQRPGATEPVSVEKGERVVLQYPLEPGTTWYTNSETLVLARTGPPQRSEFKIVAPVKLKYTIEALDETVRVPAGNFRNCLQVRATGKTRYNARNYVGLTNITVEKTDWYAPGIGLVKSERRETTSSKVLNHGRMQTFAGRVVMELESFKHN